MHGDIMREPRSIDNGHLRAENAITLYAIDRRWRWRDVQVEEMHEGREGKGVRERERRRGGSRFTHTKSRRARIVHDGNQTHKSEA